MRRGTLFVLASAFLWGTTFPSVRYVLDEGRIGPYAFLYYRFALATLAMLALAIAQRRLDFALFRDWRLLGLSAVNALGYLLQFLAQDRTTASKTALLVNVNVLLTALVAYYLLRERIASTTWWGVFAGLVGVALLTTNGSLGTVRFSNGQFVGDLMAFGTGFCWTIYILALKRYFTERPHADVFAITTVLFVVTTLLLFPLALATDGLAFHGNLVDAAAIGYLALLPTTGAFILYQEGLRSTTAAVSSILLLFENLVAISISWFAFEEEFTRWTATGAVLILLATYLASRTPATETTPPLPLPTTGPTGIEESTRIK